MSALSLAVDGSIYAGSVALLRNAEVIAERTLAAGTPVSKGGRDETLLPLVAECLDQCGVGVSQLTRVVCGAGPGSFTSLRIAASVAKGLAVGAGCPLFAVSSILLGVAGMPEPIGSGLYLSLLPAMRGESFAAEVSVDDAGRIVQVSRVRIVNDDDVAGIAERTRATTIGPGWEVDANPHARGVGRLLAGVIEGGACGVDTWEPDYGRLAEAQVKWEAAHGRPLFVST